MKTTLAVVLIAGAAWAGQTAVGNWLTRPEYKTLATATYYVSPLGSDTGACTATGTGACATLTGVIAKLPQNINHAITINVAGATDGGIATYTENPVFNNLNVNAAITITGPSLVNAAPATGTATGTLTAVTLGTVTVLTDSTQSWTVNGLIGNFVTISSVQRVIATNTATTMTLASPFTSNPVIGSSYAIQTPAAVFTSGTSPTLGVRLSGNTGGGGTAPTFGLTNLEFANTATSGVACNLGSTNQSITLTTSCCRHVGGAFGTGIRYLGGGQLSVQTTAAVSSGRGLATVTITTGSSSAVHTLNPNNSLFYGAGSDGITTASSPQALMSLLGSSTWTAQTGLATGAAFNNSAKVTGGGGIITGPVFRCTGALTSSAGYRVKPATSADYSPTTETGIYAAVIDGCVTGIDLSGNTGNGQFSFTTNGALTCTNTSTCVAVANGSRVRLPGTLAMQDGGTDISIDGVTYTATQLTGASPTRLTNFATGSAVWQ